MRPGGKLKDSERLDNAAARTAIDPKQVGDNSGMIV